MSVATFSPCGTYRYTLGRTWGDPESQNRLAVCMLNPSTATALVDDPTISRCIGFAKREGCDGLDVLNAYALRSTDPRALLTHADPVGPDNDSHLCTAVWSHSVIVVAWGVNITPKRQAAIAAIIDDANCTAMCLGVTKDGFPRHPLYVRSDQPLVPWVAPVLA